MKDLHNLLSVSKRDRCAGVVLLRGHKSFVQEDHNGWRERVYDVKTRVYCSCATRAVFPRNRSLEPNDVVLELAERVTIREMVASGNGVDGEERRAINLPLADIRDSRAISVLITLRSQRSACGISQSLVRSGRIVRGRAQGENSRCTKVLTRPRRMIALSSSCFGPTRWGG